MKVNLIDMLDWTVLIVCTLTTYGLKFHCLVISSDIFVLPLLWVCDCYIIFLTLGLAETLILWKWVHCELLNLFYLLRVPLCNSVINANCNLDFICNLRYIILRRVIFCIFSLILIYVMLNVFWCAWWFFAVE